jgi:diguanylate cyclase (GGDEF)-like protein
MESDLERVGRSEWWLWLSVVIVTVLSGIVYLLSSFSSLFPQSGLPFEVSSDRARWAVLSLLLLFDAWLVYRQWLFRRLRRQLTGQTADSQSSLENIRDPSGLDPVTGFYTRASAEQRLGKEFARARRHNIPLTLVAFHLDDFAQLSELYGGQTGNQILMEFANRLRKTIRGSDFGARLASNDFLLVLPECRLRDARIVSDRLDTSKVRCIGREISLTYSVGWIDYQPGEMPWELLKRASDVLRLYKEASKDTVMPLVARRLSR